MKLTKSLLIVTLACGTLWAQAPADKSAKAPAKNPPPAGKNAPAAKAPAANAKPAATPAGKPAVVPAGKPAAAPVMPVKGTAQAKPVSKTPATAAKPVATTPVASKGTTPAKPVATAKPAAKSVAPAKSAAKPVATAKSAAKPVATAKSGPAPVASKAMAPKTPFAPHKAAVVKVPVKAAPAKTVVAKKGTNTEAPAKPASAKEETAALRVGKQRDPFVSPVVRSTGTIGPACDTGKRCLVVDQIVLKGIVKSPAGFIAVVENPAKRAYFMRENDPVFNGKITKITGDTVVFQEQVMDKLGKQSMREVVKKVNAPIV